MTVPARRGRFGPRRYDPFARMGSFEGLFDQMSRMLTSAFPDVARIHVNSWSPPVDVHEGDESYVVEADVPGVAPEDVQVDLQDRELRITGEYGSTDTAEGASGATDQASQQGDQQQGDQQRTRQQGSRRSGRFDYRVTLPGEVRADQATAHLEHGVLQLTLPKAVSGSRRIQVQAGDSAASDPSAGSAGSGGSGRSASSG